MDYNILLYVFGGFSGGAALAYFVWDRLLAAQKRQRLLRQKEEVDREREKRESRAKEKYLRLKHELEKKLDNRKRDLREVESNLQQKRQELQKERDEIERKSREVNNSSTRLKKESEAIEQTKEMLRERREELEQLYNRQVKTLESLSGLSVAKAKEQLMESLEGVVKTEAMAMRNEILEEAKINAHKDAKKLIVNSMQRIASETVIENAVTTFHIDNNEIKGMIIGREGRNIRTLEAATGVELIIDDTPETILLSCFDPVRRELARLALSHLIADGRIHPARIEEVVEKVRKDLDEEIIETGKKTAIDLGIHNLHPKLLRMVGRMKYRSSYGQNLLQHSRETANLCSAMAAELGLNVKLAKRAGLLHDIGKMAEDEQELPHALLGMKIAEQCKENPEVCNAIGSHHEEVEVTTLLSPIVQVCDAISGARPGARKEVVDAYIKRIKEMEKLALSFPGVEKTYAIQAGRELRVIVGAKNVDDRKISTLSADIASKIQDSMVYPGQVKITVIRETRAINYAR